MLAVAKDASQDSAFIVGTERDSEGTYRHLLQGQLDKLTPCVHTFVELSDEKRTKTHVVM